MDSMERDRGKYIEDIKIIKDIMLKTENEPVYENWAFYAWGVIIITASIIHFFIEAAYNYSPNDLFIKVWLPGILLMLLVETVSIVRNWKKFAYNLFKENCKAVFKCIQSINCLYLYYTCNNKTRWGSIPSRRFSINCCMFIQPFCSGRVQTGTSACLYIYHHCPCAVYTKNQSQVNRTYSRSNYRYLITGYWHNRRH
ncbi:MAG: hypothetical protein DRP57_06795 [Spirochaetes bacterium]|nr:MAG: hypothetical protein DRP57_06795 [Spirochaetota bacterium]